MQIIALVTLLTETFQPVLANKIVVVMVAVFIRTQIAQWAEALAVCLTDRSVRIETEAVFAFEEVGEGKFRCWRLLVFVRALVIEIHRRNSTVVDCGGHGV